MNLDIEKVISWLNQLYGAPKITLVFVSCLLLGLFIKYGLKAVHNSGIPIIVVMWGAFWLPALSDWPESSAKTVTRFILFNGFFGACEGFIATMIHRWALKPLLKKIGVKDSDDTAEFTKPPDPPASDPMSRGGKAALLFFCLALCGLCGCHAAPVTHGIPNLAQVEPGVWRGGQPNDEGWKWLKSQEVATVIKLNTESEASDNAARNLYGMEVWGFPLTTGQQLGFVAIPKDYFDTAIAAFPMPKAQLASFGLPSNYSHGNVFIHCQHGQDRTGLFVACYRVAGHQEGWTRERAEKEMLALGFHKSLHGLWEAWENFKP